MKNIYVGNIPYSISGQDLGELFSSFGEVKSANVVTDRETGRSKGFGFVEMADSNSASTAINEMNGKTVSGRQLVVNEAKPRN